ncbi:excinuclease ABC subunit UvrA [Brevibacterium litoralis]|uniref:excinuclease ABC subunit UvrA n=1 Tax=Brevibacterium litoralis TaxID=3138935 RepID=UPI0032EAA50F
MTTPIAADAHDEIRVHGARENNLTGFDLTILKRRLTVFTGVSGSGKSSLVFGTLAAESQRLINETYSAFVQGFMPQVARPDVDHLEGLTPAIVVDQERLTPNNRSTVGTVSDAYTLLRLLYAKKAEPHVGGPAAFSFNTASVSAAGAATVHRNTKAKKEKTTYFRQGGMCAGCEGTGEVSDIDISGIIDEDLSLNDGAVLIPGYKPGGWSVRSLTETGFFDPDKKIRDYTAQERHDLLEREPGKVNISGTNFTYEGLLSRVQKSFLSKDRDALQPHVRAFVDRIAVFRTCPDCEGYRLNEVSRSALIGGLHIGQVTERQISDLPEWLESVDTTGVEPLVATLVETVDAFREVGLGYLSLDRPSGTLSGGEAQRVKLVRHLGSSLTDITYVFDEPTVGLHPHDIHRMNDLLLRLRDKGNTVLVVEHKPETIRIADHVVDLGPRAGTEGGSLQYEGTVDGLLESGTLTGEHLGYRAELKDTVRPATGVLSVRGAGRNNLRDVDVDVPLGVLCAVTGVAGSGKSTLVDEGIVHDGTAPREDVVVLDQSAIRGSRRSNPGTYTGVLDPIRSSFAKANGVKPGLFSANSDGACENCKGAGQVFVDLGLMAGTAGPCEVCEGRRFKDEVLDMRLGGRNIAEVLDMSVAQARAFVAKKSEGGEAPVPKAHTVLSRLDEVGLGYVKLGQSLNTLSGGERQRLKLAVALGEKGKVLVLDEPTTGLHLADVAALLDLLDRLVDGGRSVIVVEHHLAVVAHADHVIDLGPGAGREGGRIVFEGTPRQMVEAADSTVTGEFLAAYVG